MLRQWSPPDGKTRPAFAKAKLNDDCVKVENGIVFPVRVHAVVSEKSRNHLFFFSKASNDAFASGENA